MKWNFMKRFSYLCHVIQHTLHWTPNFLISSTWKTFLIPTIDAQVWRTTWKKWLKCRALKAKPNEKYSHKRRTYSLTGKKRHSRRCENKNAMVIDHGNNDTPSFCSIVHVESVKFSTTCRKFESCLSRADSISQSRYEKSAP